jgi:hypothetical protein
MKCDLIFEDGFEADAVDAAFLKRPGDEDPSFDEAPIRNNEILKAKYKRTWLTLPSQKRRCFHKSMWAYHQQRFNPFYDEDVHSSAPAAAGAGAAAAADTGASDFQSQFRKAKRGERTQVKVKML